MINVISPNQLSILIYHGVTKQKGRGIENRFGKHMFEAQFVDQMRWLKEQATVLSMDQVAEYYRSGASWPRNAVAITFDDGFENNYSIAAPILEDFGLSAMFYVTSGMINTSLMFWVDKLEDCLNLTSKKTINIALEGNSFRFALDTDDLKHNTLFIIKQYCKNCSADQKDMIVKQVEEQTEVMPDVSHSENYLKLTWNQVKELYNHKFFTIGGHSLYHNILSKLSFTKMGQDITASLELLRYNLGEIRHYSYPEGHPEHFTHQTVEVLKQAGIVCCPTAISGFNDLSSDLFLLRRNHTNLAKIY